MGQNPRQIFYSKGINKRYRRTFEKTATTKTEGEETEARCNEEVEYFKNGPTRLFVKRVYRGSIAPLIWYTKLYTATKE